MKKVYPLFGLVGSLIWCVAILALLVLSEGLHAVFLGTGFDLWDLLASLSAMLPMAMVNAKQGQPA